MSLADGQLTLLCLRAAFGRGEVVAALRVALPGAVEDEPALLEEVSAFLIANRMPAGMRVTLGVPRAEFFLRSFETPPVRLSRLPELVGFEIERHLPGRREEFLCGWMTRGRNATGGHAILLGAVRKGPIERVAGLLARANLAPASIQPEPFAIAESLRRIDAAARDAVVIDLGQSAVGVDIVRNGLPITSRVFPIDSPQWRDSFVAPAAQVPGEAAADSRRTASRQLAEALSARVGSPLFKESLPGGVFPWVLLTGLGANRAELSGALLELLGAPVRAVSPWPAVQWAKPPADLAPYGAALALAQMAGSGARGLELAAERQEDLHRAPSLRLTAALAGLLTAVLLAQLGSCGLRQQRVLAQVDVEIKELRGKMDAVEAVHRRVQEQRARLGYLTSTVSRRARQAEILRELTGLIPDAAYLSEYTFRERTVEITGLAPSASLLLPVLEASPLFTNVEFSAPIVAQGAGLERFRIRLRLEASGG